MDKYLIDRGCSRKSVGPSEAQSACDEARARKLGGGEMRIDRYSPAYFCRVTKPAVDCQRNESTHPGQSSAGLAFDMSESKPSPSFDRIPNLQRGQS